MDDVIYRQDSVNELREYITEPSISDDESEIIGYNDGIELAISVLSTMPSAQQWIPCSERLPEKPNTYIATVDYGKQGLAVGQRYYHGDYPGWDDDCVIAWMPLPEPYKGETK